MARTLKFRAMKDGQFRVIDLSNGQRWAKELLTLIAENENTLEFDTPLEQFTGLLDKNGKEIYEGDILLCENTHRVVVEWGSGGFRVNGETISANLGGVRRREVLGNIHETPTLLKEESKT